MRWAVHPEPPHPQDCYRNEVSIPIDTREDEIVEFRERQRVLTLVGVQAALSAGGFARVDCFADLAKTLATDQQFDVFLGWKRRPAVPR